MTAAATALAAHWFTWVLLGLLVVMVVADVVRGWAR